MARRLVYCKVVLATSMVWFLLDVMLIMYYSECNSDSRCNNQALDHGVPRELEGGHEHAPPRHQPARPRHDPNGPGEMGKAVIIPQDKESLKNEMFRINQFNLLASDMISVNRTLPDVRMDG
nr:polypeptide N-acetylgalactosaminyltransferase 13-like [Lytechinus pictus]